MKLDNNSSGDNIDEHCINMAILEHQDSFVQILSAFSWEGSGATLRWNKASTEISQISVCLFFILPGIVFFNSIFELFSQQIPHMTKVYPKQTGKN